jgi:hypothetical protein
MENKREAHGSRRVVCFFVLGGNMGAWFEIILLIPIAYLGIGLIFNCFAFICAKVKGLDEEYEEWDMILNSIGGVLYFLFMGILVWLPMIASIRKDRKGIHRQKQLIAYQRLKTGLQKMLERG